jgi:hypothetical protein
MKIGNHHNQSFKRARLCTRYDCMPLTKVKISQVCKRSDLSWNRPRKGITNCILWCWKYDRYGKQYSIGEK